MNEWFVARALAGLPGMPTTVTGILKVAKREGWKSRPRQGRGGGREFHFLSLPLPAREALGFGYRHLEQLKNIDELQKQTRAAINEMIRMIETPT